MDKNIDFSNQMELEHILGDIDLNEDAPVEEPARQYYFIAKARKYITEISAKLGRPLFSHVETFGCPRAMAPPFGFTFSIGISNVLIHASA